ncbi:MAG: hypothetical protein WA060_02500 [Minisyncoccia bacterium]
MPRRIGTLTQSISHLGRMLTQGNEMNSGTRRTIMDTAGFNLTMVIGPRMEEIHRALKDGDSKMALELLEKEIEYSISI